jgi:serralysin
MAPTKWVTTDEAAAIIARENDPWGPGYGIPATASYGFVQSGFAFTPEQMATSREVMDLWSDVAQISFVFSSDPDIRFENFRDPDRVGAAKNHGTPSNGEVTVGFNRAVEWGVTQLGLGEKNRKILIHEIGHAIGLSHPGDYNAGEVDDKIPTYETDAAYVEDSRQYSVMSYFSEDKTGANFNGQFARTPLLHDIAAAQRLYGANMTTRTGDTVYGFNSNADREAFHIYNLDEQAVFAIWDAGGNDTLDFSGYADDQTISLWDDSFSSVGGLSSNVAIAKNAMIENAVGGSGRDTIYGNNLNNVLSGGSGDDTLYGNAGEDVLYGGAGNDTMKGGSGADFMSGGRDDDTYEIDNAGDVILERPGEGFDRASVYIDTYRLPSEVEQYFYLGRGSATARGNDMGNVMVGGGGADTIYGEAGNDVINGLGGADFMIGGDGDDTYFVDNTGDRVIEGQGQRVLVSDFEYGYTGGNDTVETTLASYALPAWVENLTYTGTAAFTGTGNELANVIAGGKLGDTLKGMAGNDTLLGRDGADILDGGEGDDLLKGGTGADTIKGGSGVDTASYAGSAAGVVVNLSTRIFTGYSIKEQAIGSSGGDAEGDMITGVENVIGSGFADTLNGNGDNNVLDGSLGNDLLDGKDGDDILVGGAGADTLKGGAGIDTASYEGSASGVTVSLSYMSFSPLSGGFLKEIAGPGFGGDAQGDRLYGIENLIGSDYKDELHGNSDNNALFGGDGDDVLDGGAGADHLNGGAGNDTADYRLASTGIVVDFEAPQLNTGDAAGDTYSSIEIVLGTDYDDQISLSNGNDNAAGGAGNDYIDGRDGFNIMKGEAGNDIIFGGANTDIIEAGDDNDLVFGGGGADLIRGGNGEDLLFAQDGDDFLFGSDGNDDLGGGAGADALDGGDGFDIADYSFGSTEGVVADLASPFMNTGDAAGDTYKSIEGLLGTAFADDLRGDDGANTLQGWFGDDVLTGRGGADTFFFASSEFDGASLDTITDFDPTGGTGDILRFTDGVFQDFDHLYAAASQDGDNVSIAVDADSTVLLLGVAVENLRADQFLFA